MLGKIFSKQHFKLFFLFFPWKKVLTFHANCRMKDQSLFSGKNKKNIVNLSSAELAQRVVKVNA